MISLSKKILFAITFSLFFTPVFAAFSPATFQAITPLPATMLSGETANVSYSLVNPNPISIVYALSINTLPEVSNFSSSCITSGVPTFLTASAACSINFSFTAGSKTGPYSETLAQSTTSPFNPELLALNTQIVGSPPATVPVTVTITGNLLDAGNPNVAVSMTGSTAYGPVSILADGQAHTFANMLPGNYTAAPPSITLGNTAYTLQNANYTVSSTQTNISLEYDAAQPSSNYPIMLQNWAPSNNSYGELTASVDNSTTTLQSIQLYYPTGFNLSGNLWGGLYNNTACTSVPTSLITNMSEISCPLTVNNATSDTSTSTMTLGLNAIGNSSLSALSLSSFLVGLNNMAPQQGTLVLTATPPGGNPAASYQPIVTVDGIAHAVPFNTPGVNVSLYEGIPHTVTAQPLVVNSLMYTPTYVASPVINASQNTSDEINFATTPQNVTLMNVNFTIGGITSGDSANVIVNNNNYTVSQALHNGVNTLQVPTVGVYSIQLQNSANNYYPSMANITVVNGQAPSATSIQYIHSGVYAVGYVDYTASPPNLITQAVENGYSMIVVAFASLNGDGSVNLFNTINATALWNDMTAARAYAQQNGIPLKILISFGGAAGNNTFTPPANATIAAQAAQNTINFVNHPDPDNNSIQFDGVDFDIEIHVDPTLFADLVDPIRASSSNIIISAAPQLNTNSDGQGLYFVTTAYDQDYDTAISHGDFNYLFAQEYNTSSACVSVSGNPVCEGDPTFTSASFQTLANQVPANTKVVVGAPATTYASTNTISDDTSANIFRAPVQSTSASANTLSTLASQLSSINTNPQFGGVMSWAINLDATGATYPPISVTAYQDPWQFIRTVVSGL